MIDDPRKGWRTGNVCFVVLMTDGNSAMVEITDHSWSTDSRLVGKKFKVSNKFLRANVRRGDMIDGLDYVLTGLRSKVEADENINAYIRYPMDLSEIEILSITPEHSLRNLVGQTQTKQKLSQDAPIDNGINNLATAFENASPGADEGGTSDGGDGKEIPAKDDIRTRKVLLMEAPRGRHRRGKKPAAAAA